MTRDLIFVLTGSILIIIALVIFKDYITIDKCLDQGGKWNYQDSRCNPSKAPYIGDERICSIKNRRTFL
jgi:hypothetical protein